MRPSNKGRLVDPELGPLPLPLEGAYQTQMCAHAESERHNIANHEQVCERLALLVKLVSKWLWGDLSVSALVDAHSR